MNIQLYLVMKNLQPDIVTYPRLAEWSLSKREPGLSNRIIEGYFSCGNNFKSLAEIKKFIRDRKYL